MIEDPENPSQFIGPDGSYQFNIDEHTAPIANGLRALARKEISQAKDMRQQVQAFADAFEMAFAGLGMLEIQVRRLQRDAGDRPD